MTIGTAFAISRLKTQDIYCISPSRVNVSGRIDTMCFDKTGTLTEEGLSVFGAQPMEEDT
jgi:cation-transporting ATPase 13A2